MATSNEKKVPTEFALFVRGIGIRAFDQLADRADDLDKDNPARKLAKTWRKLESEQKENFFDMLITAGELIAAAAPVAVAAVAKAKEKRKNKKAEAAAAASAVEEKPKKKRKKKE